MQLGMIGLGRMSANIARRLMRAGHSCVVYDANPKAADALAAEGAVAVKSLAELKAKLTVPRAAWIMVPRERSRALGAGARHALRAGRRHHRWRQQQLEGRCAARQSAGGQRPALSGCRHERRCLGPRARLLHDDRRRQGRDRSPQSDLPQPGAWSRRHRAHAGGRGPRSPCRAGLYPCRPELRRAFRQDGA